MNVGEKNFDLDKKRFLYESLKTWNSYFLAVYPCRWSQDRHAHSCDVDSGACDLRLDSFLFSFTSANLASLSTQNGLFQHFIKQARWVKYVFFNVRHNSFQTKGRLVRMMDQNGGKFERFKNSVKRLHFIEIEIFFPESLLGDI